MLQKDVEMLLLANELSDPNDADLVRRAFTREKLAGYPSDRVEVAHDGEDLLDLLLCRGRFVNRHSWDLPRLVMLDLKPSQGAGGMEVPQQTKTAASGRRLPLLILKPSQEQKEEKNPADHPPSPSEPMEGVLNDTGKQNHLGQMRHQSQQMEAMGRLASGVTHDFNNLLMIIKDCSNRLMEQLGDNEGLCRDAGEIHRTAERAASLTGQLLAFSRQQVLEPRLVDPNHVLTDMSQMLRRLVGKDIELLISCRPELGRVKADPGQLEQVILNLAVNARDAMPQGGKLTIETANVELDETSTRALDGVKPGPYVMLAVSDTGCGIDPAIQTRIWEPFFTTKQQSKGTGLGLAIVNEIVKKNSGHIAVYSKPGWGTAVKVFLPRHRKATKAAKPSNGSKTVLLVEDQKAVREIVSTTLQRKGYTVLEADNSAEATHICEQHRGLIHLMLTDVFMPDMNGRDLASHLSVLRPDMKVLYMSGYTNSFIFHHGILNPDADLIQKPFSPSDLTRRVLEVLTEVRAGSDG